MPTELKQKKKKKYTRVFLLSKQRNTFIVLPTKLELFLVEQENGTKAKSCTFSSSNFIYRVRHMIGIFFMALKY